MVLRTDDIAASGPDLGEAIGDYQLALHAAGRSKNTQAVYTLALTYLDRYLAEKGMPRHLSAIRREGFVKESPMVRMAPPLVPEKSPAILRDDQLEALLKALWSADCSRRSEGAPDGGGFPEATRGVGAAPRLGSFEPRSPRHNGGVGGGCSEQPSSAMRSLRASTYPVCSRPWRVSRSRSPTGAPASIAQSPVSKMSRYRAADPPHSAT